MLTDDAAAIEIVQRLIAREEQEARSRRDYRDLANGFGRSDEVAWAAAGDRYHDANVVALPPHPRPGPLSGAYAAAVTDG